MSKKEKIKIIKSRLINILRWILGMILGFIGLSLLFIEEIIFPSIVLIIISIILIPPFFNLIKELKKNKLSKKKKIKIIWISIVIIIIIVILKFGNSPQIYDEYVTPESLENVLPESLENKGIVSHIEAYATLDTWDTDADIDGVNVRLRIFSNPYSYIQAKGLLKVSIYRAIGFMDDQKGELIESFTKELDINDFTTGTCGNEEKYCGFIREIRFDFTKPNNLGDLNFGYMELIFETQGKTFEAVDKTFN